MQNYFIKNFTLGLLNNYLGRSSSLYMGKDRKNKNRRQSDSESSGAVDRIKKGRWTPQENQKYLEFLLSHLCLFKRDLNKRSTRVFKLLAKEIPRRSP